MDTVRVIYNDDGCESVVYAGKIRLVADVYETARDIEGALSECGYKVVLTPLAKNSLDRFIEEIKGEGFVFNLCEGAFGESRLEMNVAALLELYGVAFTGNSSATLSVALNKGWTKDILRGAGIPTANYTVVKELPARVEGMKFPLMVKPLMEDGGAGIGADSVVTDTAGLKRAAENALKDHPRGAIVEEYIEGREFNISVMGGVVLPVAEIDFSGYPAGAPRVLGFEAKWIEDSPFYVGSTPRCPANIGDGLRKELEEISLGAFRALCCRDYARIDIRLGKEGIRVLEVNPNPDISKNAGFARAARAAGMGYSELIDCMVKIALKRKR
jgi:D-alanine-D-alanine ligase